MTFMDTELMNTQITEVLDLQKRHALKLRTSTAEERIELIQKLHDRVLSHREEIRKALYADYRKPFIETDISEIYPVVSEAKHTIKNLKQWKHPDEAGLAGRPDRGTRRQWLQVCRL